MEFYIALTYYGLFAFIILCLAFGNKTNVDKNMKFICTVWIIASIVYLVVSILNYDFDHPFGFAFVNILVIFQFKYFARMPKNIDDLDDYKKIDDIIAKYGIPDNVEQFEAYKKYTFKKSANGLWASKYKVDIFTLQNDKLVKHEKFYV